MVVRHREFIHDYEARDPGREEQGLRDQNAKIKRCPTPGHYNTTLGGRFPVNAKPGSTAMSKAKLKTRISIAKVWKK